MASPHESSPPRSYTTFEPSGLTPGWHGGAGLEPLLPDQEGQRGHWPAESVHDGSDTAPEVEVREPRRPVHEGYQGVRDVGGLVVVATTSHQRLDAPIEPVGSLPAEHCPTLVLGERPCDRSEGTIETIPWVETGWDDDRSSLGFPWARVWSE